MAKLLVLCFALAICNVFAKPPVDQLRQQDGSYASTANDDVTDFESRARDDYTYKFGNSWYKYHRTPLTFARAQLACQAEGAHLAIINSADEANYLVSIMNQNTPLSNVQHKDHVLVGFHDAFETNVYFTIDGHSLESAGYTTFGDHKPTYDGRCGSIYRDGTLNDFPCGVRSPFICEYRPWQNHTVEFAPRMTYSRRVSESLERQQQY